MRIIMLTHHFTGSDNHGDARIAGFMAQVSGL